MKQKDLKYIRIYIESKVADVANPDGNDRQRDYKVGDPEGGRPIQRDIKEGQPIHRKWGPGSPKREQKGYGVDEKGNCEIKEFLPNGAH